MIRLKKFRVISFILTVVLFFNMALFFDGGISLADDVNLLIEKMVSTNEVYVGETFTYTIKYSNPNTTTHANDVVLTDLLPNGVKYVDSTLTPDIERVEVTDKDGRDEVKFIFNDPLHAGTTGVIKITAKFEEGVTANNTVRTNAAIITPKNGLSVTSNEVSITAKTKPSNWTVNKSRIIPSSATPALDQPVTYEISITGNDSIGGLNLTNVKACDVLPPGSTYVSSDDGNYNSDNHTVTWDIGNINVGAIVKKQVVITYDSGVFKLDSTVTNVAIVTGTALYSSETETKTDEVSHGFAPASPGIGSLTKTSRQSNDEYAIGQTAEFYIGNIKNTGNVPLTNFYIEDILPNKVDLKSITSGKYNQSGLLDIYYKSNNKTDWTLWQKDISRTSSAILNTSDLVLNSGEYITNVKWNFGTVNPGFTNTSSINVNGEILGTDHLGVEVRTGASITNTAILLADDVSSKSAVVTIKVVDPIPWLDPNKSRVGKSAYYEEERVSFKLTLKNHNYATGDLKNPTFIDVLPQELEDIQIESCSVSPTPTISTYKKTIDGEERDVFKWTFSGKTLKPGEFFEVTYSGKIKDSTLAGHVNNIMYMTTTDEFKSPSKENDTLNLDNDSDTDYLVKSDASIFVKFVGTLSSEKLVNGELDTVWSKYPAEGRTLPGGIADYQLEVSNTNANGPVGNIVVIDVLPYIGDKGLIDTKPRESKWRPYLVNEIKVVSLPADADENQIKIYYSTSSSPSLSQLYNPLVKNNSGWSETPPEDITTVKSLKFDFGNINLNVDEKIILEWPMRAPVGAIEGEATWNSFGYGATYPDENGPEPFIPSEPIMVGYFIQSDPSDAVNLGDYVWEDMNRNGVQDVEEKGINGVLVELLDDSGNPIEGEYTRTGFDQNGNPGYYLFPNLSSGDYKVRFTEPSGYKISPKDQGGNEALDSDINGIGITDRISLDGVNDNLDVDAGLYKASTIGDFVWHDKDADGIQDSGEPGLENITVELYDSGNVPLDTRTTSAIGLYQFTKLDPGNYYVKVITGNQYHISPATQGAIRTKDSNIDVNGKSELITINSGESNLSIDAGLYLGAIGDFIWHDKNADGIQDSGEEGLVDIDVHLYKDSSKIDTTKTGSNGYYQFKDLFPGNYAIEVEKGGYQKYSPQNTTDSSKDSNGDPLTGKSSEYTLTAGERISTMDQGLYNLVSLGDILWHDLNYNGQQDGSEPGIQGATVILKQGTTTVDTTSTDANGNYSFTSLFPGSYRVEFIKPDGFSGFTVKDNGDDASDSDAATNSGIIDNIILESGDNDITNDAGLFQYASVGDYIWEDVNLNGLQDVGEDGISNVSVVLYEKIGSDYQVKASTTTNENGYYGFNQLLPGNYQIKIIVPNGYKLTTINSGSDDQVDSDFRLSDSSTEVFTLESGENNLSLDAGLYKLSKLGNYIWLDKNANGEQDDDESGIEDIEVKLLDDKDAEIASTKTDSNGGYLFDYLDIGKYKVKVVLPLGYVVTKKNINDDTKDSDIDYMTHETELITLASNESNLTLDAGLYRTAAIGDYVWEDMNGNGIQETTEPAIKDVNISLILPDNSTSGAITNDNGFYQFIDLVPDTYKVQFEVPAGYILTSKNSGIDDGVDSNPDTNTGLTDDIVLESNEVIPTIDTGFYRPVRIGDFVWLDENQNGIQDSGEEGAAGVNIKLILSDDTTLETETDENGFYEFNNLTPGAFKVVFTAPERHGFTVLNAGNQDEDSNADTNSGMSDEIMLLSNGVDLTIDAGICKLPESDEDATGSIGNYVWYDTNYNGIQDSNEEGVFGVKVTITYPNGITKTTTTNSNGKYLFEDLKAGSYSLKFEKPDGYSFTINDTGDDSKDSDVSTSGKIHGIFLDEEENNMDQDAGLVGTAELGDFAFIDQNDNNLQDDEDQSMEDLNIKLYNNSDELVAETTTNEEGYYKFEKLFPGEYYIKVDKPDGYSFITKDAGDDFLDSDISANGESDRVMLDINESILTLGIGLKESIEAEEPIDEEEDEPIAGGDVVIKDKDGNVIKEDTIDEDGNIDLTDLPKNTPLTITITKDGVVIDEITIEIPDENIPLGNVDLKDFSILPKTGTHDYNLLVLGFILLAAGIYFMTINHRKKGN